MHSSLKFTFAWDALRTKIGPDEAESEGGGGSTVEEANEVWPDLRRNPKGWGQFSPFRGHSSLEDSRFRRSSLLEPRKTGSRRHPRES